MQTASRGSERGENIVIRTIVLGIVLLLVPISFLSVDSLDLFLAQSQTNAQHSLGTAVTQTPDGSIVRQRGLIVRLAHSEHETFATTLVEDLTARLATELNEELLLVERSAAADTGDRPLVLIEITDWAVSWTPFWAEADIEIRLAYASDGDVSWRQNQAFQSDPSTRSVQARGTLHLRDETRGLMTYNSYEEHLGEAVAHKLYAVLQAPLFDPPQ